MLCRATIPVLSLGLVALCLARPAGADGTGTELSIETLYGAPALVRALPAVAWLGESRGVSYVADRPTGRTLVIREVPSGRERVVFVADTVTVPADLHAANATFAIGTHTWNAAGSQAVFMFGGDVFLVRAKDGVITRVTDTDASETDPTFSPDGSQLAYTRGNDLYSYDVGRNIETRHTNTGSESILNGILDWIYMEELFTRGNVRAFWWAPDSRHLAFLEINEDPVPVFPIVDHSPVRATARMQHYPKAGDPAPIVRVGVASVAGGGIVWTDVDTRDDSYIARVNWLGDASAVAIEKVNRAQDRLTLFFADAASGRSEVVLEESSAAWVNVTYAKHFYQARRQFTWGSERDGHSHLYLFNLDGTPIRQLTQGAWEVFELAGADEKKKRVYFTANEANVLERHLYRINEDGKDMKRITTEAGTHDVEMSPDRKYFIDRYSTSMRPQRLSVFNADGKKLFDVADQVTDTFAALRLPTSEFLTIEHDGQTFHCSLMKPLDFDASKRHPVIVYVYGGPHSQTVRRVWGKHDLWHAYMASRGYLIFSMDNRGTHARGKAWEEPLLKEMGTTELADQVAGVEYLRGLPYVDPDRIGIWGWSYGGYVALLGLFNAGDVFAAGAAVAPVTDWRLYDSIYTERYMKLPKDNEAGYTASAPLTHVSKLEDPLLLMHGDADDNVHMQNSVQLAKALIAAGKDFDLMIYPGKEHSIVGTAERVHLYHKLTAFFDRHLKASAPGSAQLP